jgi:hypothetical protein
VGDRFVELKRNESIRSYLLIFVRKNLALLDKETILKTIIKRTLQPSRDSIATSSLHPSNTILLLTKLLAGCNRMSILAITLLVHNRRVVHSLISRSHVPPESRRHGHNLLQMSLGDLG